MGGENGTHGAATRRGVVLWAIFLGALLIRLGAIDGTIGFHTPAVSEPASDSSIHIALVNSLLHGHGYSINGAATAITPPLYIFFLTGLYRLFGGPAAVRLIQAVLGAFGCLVMYAIGRRVFNHATGLVAAAILSVYPLVVYLTGLHLTENLFLFVLLIAILQAVRVADHPTFLSAATLGGLIGLAALTRAVFVAFLPFLYPWAISLWGVRSPLALRVFEVAVIGAVAVILPWTVRNYLVFGTVIPIQSNAGLVFWAGNNPHADGGLVWPAPGTWTGDRPPDDGRYGWRGLNVAAANMRYMRTALSWIYQHPREYVRLLAQKVVRLYGVSRTGDTDDLHAPYAILLFHALLPVVAAGGLLLTVHQWRTTSLLMSLILFTHMMTLLFSGGTRYTIPMVPSLTLFAAVPVAATARHVMLAFGWDRMAESG